MTKILVTGGTGLVGWRLLGRLVAQGLECRGLVRPGKDLPDGVEVAKGDILAPETLAPALDGVTTIVHLAASFRNGNDEQTWEVNLTGTRNLIAAAAAHAPEVRFVLASTSNVYAADGTHPAREDDALQPTLAYPASKVQCEQELRASELNWSVVRLPFVYGDGDGHLEAAPGQMLRAGWHPAQRQSMAHHEDVAAAFTLAIDGAMDGRTVNIADEAPPSILEMAQLVGESCPESAEPLVNPWRGQVDVSLARSLGFRLSVRTVYQAVQQNKM